MGIIPLNLEAKDTRPNESINNGEGQTKRHSETEFNATYACAFYFNDLYACLACLFTTGVTISGNKQCNPSK